jgi:CHAT domain-containing protein
MDRKPAPLDRVRQWAAAQDALVLEYLLGEEDGYVLVIGADSAVRLERLAATGKQAQVLEIDMGPLTAKRFKGACSSEQQSGVLQRLRKPGTAEQASGAGTALAELWQLLIPESERKAILADKYRRVIVIPDGLLTQLPFEMLVVKPGEAPQYLLDAGPPILYAPSATILMNLVERKGATTTSSRPPVLTIGDCQYGRPSPKVNDESILAELAPGSRYGRLGGHLQPLPHAAKEIRWVSDVFGKKGVDVAWLQQDWATEKTVRYNVSDRRIVHFACHGLVDQEYGNLFGALALTRGPKPDDPADDGFLTLAEIYELNLKGCELAILSACDTNVGPQQRGEGVWALSRGFLVAGARRVVASNWLVDDEAAASLVSYFCSIIAKAESEGKTPDYAEALWKAKRWVRSQEKWKSPYYWAPFVLIGPD